MEKCNRERRKFTRPHAPAYLREREERKSRRNTMFNSVTELFLSEYFLMQATFGPYLKDAKRLFMSLGKTFLQPEKELESLYLMTEDERVKEINTERDYFQYRRYRQYAAITGISDESQPDYEELIKIKGDAISTAMNCHLRLEGDVSRNMVYNNLLNAANAGLTVALRLTGELQCEGVFFEKNEKTGIKNLKKAADWNDGVSILSLIRYCPDSREYNASRLYAALKDTPFLALADAVKSTYNLECDQKIEEVKLLDKAFNSPALKRDQYEPKYARILYSKALGIKDKEKAILTENKELTSSVGDLPLKLSRENRGTEKKITTPLCRADEQEKIDRALSNADLRNLSSYRPLLITGNSKYILNVYAKAIIKAGSGVHFERIDINTLTEYDFEPSSNNIFIRTIDEDTDNYCLLFLFGDLSDRATEAVKSFLQSSKRCKFHINSPSVTLDLSEVLPVCFCDEKNAETFKHYCDVVRIADISQGAKPMIIQDMLRHKSKIYGLKKITLADGATDLFTGCNIDDTEKILDEAIRAHRIKNGAITLTKEMIAEYITENSKNKMGFGFGGMNDEI